VLTDNGSCYRSHRWRDTCQQLDITPSRTRPYRPQTNGKVERFNRTLVEGWADRRRYPSEAARRAAFSPWLHWYNHHRPHSALRGHPPITRCTNLPEPYSLGQRLNGIESIKRNLPNAEIDDQTDK
jgi:transposase InsO family protein